MPRRSLLAALCVVVACGSPPAPTNAVAPYEGGYLTVLEAPPYPPITRLGPDPVEQTLENRRWQFASRYEERELLLLRRIKREAVGSFGGVEWRWRDGPENGGLGELTGIVYFLREPANTLARFTRSPRYKAAQGDFARTDQEKIARLWAEKVGLTVASERFGNMEIPGLDVALSRAEFERRARKEGWRLPRNLKIRLNSRAEPNLPAVSPELKAAIRAFPQEQRLSRPSPDIATFDAIVLRDGCFFIDQAGDNDPLVQFPLGIGVYRDAEGFAAFRPRYADDKRRLGRAGTRLQLGFRSHPRAAPPELARACKARTIVSVTSVDQAAGYGGAWFGVKQYADRRGLSATEAIRQANACFLTQEKTLANNRLRGGREPPTQCASLGLGGPVIPPPPPPLRSPAPSLQNDVSAEPSNFPAQPPKRLIPQSNGVCRFEERDPTERPAGLERNNYGSNMSFWADRGALLWDHSNGNVNEAMVLPGKRIVAARDGMKDLWISPAKAGHITLYSGPERFECDSVDSPASPSYR
jgi:hypothetical protein